MTSYYDEVEVCSFPSNMKKSELICVKQIEDMEFDEENLLFHWPCPCGDRFEISLVSSNLLVYHLPVTNCGEQTQLQEGEDVAKCPSCSLIIRVIYDQVNDLRDEMLIGKDDLSEDARVETTDGNKLSTVEVGA